MLKVGDVKVTADQQQSVPPWMGWLAILAGSAIAMAGAPRLAGHAIFRHTVTSTSYSAWVHAVMPNPRVR